MRLYNTLSRREEEFAPLAGRTVTMYTCGLTVYARGHVGNFRTFVALDALRRALRLQEGYAVNQVMNFTDVDDRTIAESQKAGLPLREYTGRFIAGFLEDAATLGLEPVEHNPRATDEVNLRAMCDMIAALESRELDCDYILGARMRAMHEVRDQVLNDLGRFREVYPERRRAKDPSPLKVKEVSIEDRRYVVCLNEEQRRKDAAERDAIVAEWRERPRPRLPHPRIRLCQP